MSAIPRGPDKLVCPFHNKYMSKVCHTCPMWAQVRGLNPQTGQEVDQWNCSIAFLPMLLIENSQMSRQTGAAVESFRNEVVKNSVPRHENVIEFDSNNTQQPKLIRG